MKILVAEKEKELRRQIVDLLVAQGHTVIWVGSGFEALAYLLTPYDLILIDPDLLVINGTKLARIVRVLEEHHTLLVAMVTHQVTPQSLLTRPFDRICKKPTTEAEMLHILKWVIDEKKINGKRSSSPSWDLCTACGDEDREGSLSES